MIKVVCPDLSSDLHVQVHLPLYNPAMVLLLGLYKVGNKRGTLRSGEPLLVGKLRLRLSTIRVCSRCPAPSCSSCLSRHVGHVSRRALCVLFRYGKTCRI